MGPGEVGACTMTVRLVHAPAPRTVRTEVMRVPRGWTVAQVLAFSEIVRGDPALGGVRASLWGRLVEGGAQLQDGDRLALCRDLRVDPKEARRQRYRRQGRRPAIRP